MQRRIHPATAANTPLSRVPRPGQRITQVLVAMLCCSAAVIVSAHSQTYMRKTALWPCKVSMDAHAKCQMVLLLEQRTRCLNAAHKKQPRSSPSGQGTTITSLHNLQSLLGHDCKAVCQQVMPVLPVAARPSMWQQSCTRAWTCVLELCEKICQHVSPCNQVSIPGKPYMFIEGTPAAQAHQHTDRQLLATTTCRQPCSRHEQHNQQFATPDFERQCSAASAAASCRRTSSPAPAPGPEHALC